MKLRPLSSVRCAPSPLGGGGKRRTVVVALRRDAAGRELLTWALVKAAAAGDRVLALHVADAADGGRMETGEERSGAAESLASVLSAYKGFCDRNQIDLELRLCEGPSIKRTLVAEATSSGAAHLVLGVAKSSKPLGSSATAIARFCAKRLPPSCTVTAVSNGMIVYRRDAMQQQQQQQQLSHYSAMVETPRRLYRKILDATMTMGDKAQDDLVIGDGRSLRRNMSVSMNALVSPRVKLAPGPVRCQGQEPQEVAVGWPLLRKDIKSALPDSSEISVVQWAMQLPSRCSEISPANSDQISDDRGVSRSGTDLGKPSPVIEEAKKQVPQELVSLREKYSSKYTVFSYSELAKITDGFSPEQIVGKGGAGRVYRACTQDSKELAVKVLKSSDEAMNEFVSEIDIISSVEHKNAMSLVGFCLDGGNLMLVYDYMPRGNLEEMLHGEEQGSAVFGWPDRFKVAVGVARALEYLHGDGDHRPVIHRDVKSSNILVSDDFEPKLCDFGLAMWAADAASQVTGDDVAGTFGYLAPEYFMHGKVSDKIDVYAFGVVLLELISGRKPVSAGGPRGQESLVMWANSVIQGGKLMDLVDPNLPPADGDAGEVERMALAAALGIRREPQRRPSMRNVLKLLAGDGDAVKWAKSRVGVLGDDHDDCGVVTSPDENDIQSYINLALLGIVDDDAGSVGSVDFVGTNMPLEEYMKGRWSRSSSFD
ncbi:protein kinase STUNTED-like [Phragmites australis]|uniref:protein kinase STUNTED-like n=1 Tax=Phragmites australis TaxID=29695 RepID=UPI002D76FB84|nr:protein kinase STUNTED-like [Phragmites australis]